MPSNYTGSPTAVDAPAAAPGPGVMPIGALPADLDPPNAATFAQAFKVCLDFIAWLVDKFAIAMSYGQPVERWRNALLQERFLVDHMGFPGGRIAHYDENWRGTESQVGSGATNFVQTQQYYTAGVFNAGTGGQIATLPPDATSLTRYLQLALGTAISDSSVVVGKTNFVTFANTQAIAFDFVIQPQGGSGGVNTQTVAVGVGDAAGVFTPIAGFLGVMLFKSDSLGSHWWATCGDGTGIATPVDTGIAFVDGATYYGRIEYHGSGVSDDGVEAVRVYIGGGAPVATLTSHLPSANAAPYGAPFFALTRTASGSGAPRSASVGPYRLTTNN